MHSGLIAPQFGLGRIAQSEPDEPPAAVPRPAPPAAPATPAGPTVIRKRRRHLEGAAATADLGPGQAAAQARPQKVFRLDAQRVAPPDTAPAAAARPDATPAAAGPAPADALPVPKVRRRRDPVQRPTLVRHLVFETPQPALAGSGAAAVPDPAPGVGRTQVLAAMERLRTTLDGLVRARDAYLALDEHLTGLGVLNAPS